MGPRHESGTIFDGRERVPARSDVRAVGLYAWGVLATYAQLVGSASDGAVTG
jgi:hypothetical protein